MNSVQIAWESISAFDRNSNTSPHNFISNVKVNYFIYDTVLLNQEIGLKPHSQLGYNFSLEFKDAFNMIYRCYCTLVNSEL